LAVEYSTLQYAQTRLVALFRFPFCFTAAPALNSAARAGLTQAKQKRRYFSQRFFSLGREQNFRWNKALAAAAASEDDVRKRSRGWKQSWVRDIGMRDFTV